MRPYPMLALLFGVLLMNAQCQAFETNAADTLPHAEEESEEGVSEEGEEDGAEEEGEVEEGEHEDGEGEEEEDEHDGMEKSDPLTPEMLTSLHKKIDVNGNGKVSLAEVTDFAHKMRRDMAKSELTDIMKDMDTDKDGKLSLLEFLGDQSSHSAEDQKEEKESQFKELDTNNDNHIDADELASMYHHHTNDKVEATLTNMAMKDKDLDGNGALSLREFFQHLQMEDEDPVEISDEDQEIFKKLDTDGSSTLTLKELKAWESGSFQAEEAVKKIFMKADENKDNVLTEQELHDASHAIADDEEYEPQMYLTQWAEQHANERHADEL